MNSCKVCHFKSEGVATYHGELGLYACDSESVKVTRLPQTLFNYIESYSRGGFENFRAYVVAYSKEYGVETLDELESESLSVCPECTQDIELDYVTVEVFGLTVRVCRECWGLFVWVDTYESGCADCLNECDHR